MYAAPPPETPPAARADPPATPAVADGPSITSMSALLTEPLDLYLIDLGYDSAGNETPYLFHPTNDTTR